MGPLLKGVYTATITAHEIELLATPGREVQIDAKDRLEEKVNRLSITFLPQEDEKLLHGRTNDGLHVFVMLGEPAERHTKRPTIVVAEDGSNRR
jgi:hypothetical protein